MSRTRKPHTSADTSPADTSPPRGIPPDPQRTPEEIARAAERARVLEEEERRREEDRRAEQEARRAAERREAALRALRVAALDTCLLRDDGQPVRPPTINLSNPSDAEIRAEVFYALVNAPQRHRIYRTEAGGLCQIVVRDGEYSIKEIGHEALETMIRTGGHLYFEKVIKNKMTASGFETVPERDPPGWLLRSIRDGNVPQGVPLFRGFKAHPYLYGSPPDDETGRTFSFKHGEVITAPGYHRRSGYYLTRDYQKKGVLIDLAPGATGTQIDRERARVAAAVAEIRKWLVDYTRIAPRDSDFCNMVAAYLLPFVRSAIDGPVPGFMVNATRQGSGKTNLAKWLLLPALGVEVPEKRLPQDEDEIEKRLVTDLAACRDVIFYDNITHRISSETLDLAMTGKQFSGRRLGTNTEITVRHRLIWMFTGNNATASIDMARRLFTIRLSPDRHDPDNRDSADFENGEDYTLINRDRLISAAVTLIQAWLDGPNPKPKLKGGYHGFCNIVGSIIAQAGIPGWLENADEMKSSNLRNQDETVLVEAWAQRHDTRWIAATVLLEMVRDLGVFSRIDRRGSSPMDTLYEIMGDMRDKVFAGGWAVEERTRRGAGYGYRLYRRGYESGGKQQQ